MGGLQVTRKTFVPDDGNYVRYREILTNPVGGAYGNVSITSDVQLHGHLADPVRVVHSATATGNHYFVADDGGTAADRAVMADVMGGASATTVATVRMQQVGGRTAKSYTVTVPDGQTRILMHFVVQRAAGDAAGVEAQALSLATLTDPNMLTGLTATERAQIVNFRVP